MNSILSKPKKKVNTKTQKERVLERLQNGEPLSVRKIHVEMWIDSPTKVLSDLCKDGHEIKNKRVDTLNSYFNIYYMGEWNPSFLDAFKEEM